MERIFPFDVRTPVDDIQWSAVLKSASGLHEFLNAFQAELNDVGTAIVETFVALRPLMDAPTSVRDVR